MGDLHVETPDLTPLYLEVLAAIAFYQMRGWDWRSIVSYLIWKHEQAERTQE